MLLGSLVLLTSPRRAAAVFPITLTTDITTGPVSPLDRTSGENMNCTAINTGRKAIDIGLQLVQYDGTDYRTGATCQGVKPGAMCGLDAPGTPETVYCRITVPFGHANKIRATLEDTQTGSTSDAR